MTIAPVTIRNYVVSGEFVPISSNLGVNLYVGNNESAEGIFTADSPVLSRFGSCFEYPRTVARLERELGVHLTHSEVSSYYASKALEFAIRNPVRFLELTLRKAYLLISPHEITLNRVVHYERLSSRTLSSIPLSFPAALALGIVGTALLLRSRRRTSAGSTRGFGGDAAAREAVLLPPLLAVTYLASLLPFFATSLYRMPVVPLLLLPGAYAVWWIASRLAARDLRTAGLWLVILLAAFTLASVPFIPYEPGLAKWHLDRGIVRALDRRDAEAAAEYRKAIAIAPNSAVAHHNLGIVLARSGELEEAAVRFARAAELDPLLAAAHLGLADVRRSQGRGDDAARGYRRAIEADPRSVRARSNLAALLIGSGRFHEAARLLEEALEIDPDAAMSMNNLSWVLAVSPIEELRDGERAVRLAERAVQISGGDPALLGTLAAAYAEAGEFEAAVRAAEWALALARGAGSPTEPIEEALALYRAGRPYREE
jgi:Flp pilus assembly protein TadD